MTARTVTDALAAKTPPEDHIKYAIERMQQGARMILDAIPNDSSLSSASFGPEVTAEIARRLTLSPAPLEALPVTPTSLHEYEGAGYACIAFFTTEADRDAFMGWVSKADDLRHAALSPAPPVAGEGMREKPKLVDLLEGATRQQEYDWGSLAPPVATAIPGEVEKIAVVDKAIQDAKNQAIANLRAERDELLQTNAQITKRLDDVCAERDEAALALRSMADALGPFAKIADASDRAMEITRQNFGDEGFKGPPPDKDSHPVVTTLGACRRARATLEGRGNNSGERG